jgi:hypothetical protein
VQSAVELVVLVQQQQQQQQVLQAYQCLLQLLPS